MATTDLETAAEGLLYDQSAKPEAEAVEERQEDTEAEEVTDETDAAEAEAEDVEAEDAEEAETDEDEADADDEDESTEEDADDEQPQESLHTVKVDGEEKQVTLDELKRSYSGQDFIQKGMREAAEQRKQSREVFEALQAEQQQFVETVKQIQESGFKQPPQRPDPDLLNEDPIGYMQKQAEYDAQLQEYNAQQAKFQEVSQRQAALQEQAREMHLKEQSEKLLQEIPELADPEKGAQLKEKLFHTGVEDYGFSEQEMNQISDARAVKVLRDALNWRELQKGKTEAKKKPKPPKTVKPTGRRQQPASVARNKAKEAAKKSGKLEDFASLLLEPKG